MDGERERWTNREMDKQRDGQTERWTNRDGEKYRLTGVRRYREEQGETERCRDGEIEKQREVKVGGTERQWTGQDRIPP